MRRRSKAVASNPCRMPPPTHPQPTEARGSAPDVGHTRSVAAASHATTVPRDPIAGEPTAGPPRFTTKGASVDTDERQRRRMRDVESYARRRLDEVQQARGAAPARIAEKLTSQLRGTEGNADRAAPMSTLRNLYNDDLAAAVIDDAEHRGDNEALAVLAKENVRLSLPRCIDAAEALERVVARRGGETSATAANAVAAQLRTRRAHAHDLDLQQVRDAAPRICAMLQRAEARTSDDASGGGLRRYDARSSRSPVHEVAARFGVAARDVGAGDVAAAFAADASGTWTLPMRVAAGRLDALRGVDPYHADVAARTAARYGARVTRELVAATRGDGLWDLLSGDEHGNEGRWERIDPDALADVVAYMRDPLDVRLLDEMVEDAELTGGTADRWVAALRSGVARLGDPMDRFNRAPLGMTELAAEGLRAAVDSDDVDVLSGRQRNRVVEHVVHDLSAQVDLGWDAPTRAMALWSAPRSAATRSLVASALQLIADEDDARAFAERIPVWVLPPQWASAEWRRFRDDTRPRLRGTEIGGEYTPEEEDLDVRNVAVAIRFADPDAPEDVEAEAVSALLWRERDDDGAWQLLTSAACADPLRPEELAAAQEIIDALAANATVGRGLVSQPRLGGLHPVSAPLAEQILDRLNVTEASEPKVAHLVADVSALLLRDDQWDDLWALAASWQGTWGELIRTTAELSHDERPATDVAAGRDGGEGTLPVE